LKGKFAHISDCHIGAWRDPKLRELNDKAFGNSIDICIERGLDFVIISGDIFDVGIPEMSSVRSAVRKLKQLGDEGIAVYVVYGSHDYSPTTVSFVDVLTAAGLFKNVGEFSEKVVEIQDSENPEAQRERKKLLLQPLTDPKTGARIAGLPARRGGLEKSYYGGEIESGLSGEGFSIFVFHASVNELQSLNIPIEQSLSLDELPRGFGYYAGGHLHKRSEGKIDHAPVVYPGPLFGTSYADLELTAKGEKRGFAIVEFEDNNLASVDYVDLPLPKILSKTIVANEKDAIQLQSEIETFVSKDSLDVRDAIVLLKVRGALSSGKPSDIDWFRYRTALFDRGASVVNINRIALSTVEAKRLALLGAASREEIESKLLEQHIGGGKAPSPGLASSEGVLRGTRLLRALKIERREDETRQTFDKRIWKEASQILAIEDGEDETQKKTA
jgi:DNA repair protein SbcD/Mre11